MAVYTYNPGLGPRTLSCLLDTGARTRAAAKLNGRWYIAGEVSGGANIWMLDADYNLLQAVLRPVGATTEDPRYINRGADGNVYFAGGGDVATYFSTNDNLDLVTPANSLVDRWKYLFASEGAHDIKMDNANGRVLIAGGTVGTESVHSILQTTGADAWSYDTNGSCYGLDFDGTEVYVCGQRIAGKSVWVLNNSGVLQRDLDLGVDGWAIRVASDGSVFIAGDQSSTLTGDPKTVWKLSNDLSTVLASYDTGESGHLWGMEIRPGGESICVMGDTSGGANVWELKTSDLSLVNSVDTGGTRTEHAAFDGAGHLVIVGTRDASEPCSVWLWSLDDGGSGTDMNVHDGPDGALNFCTTCCPGDVPL